MSRVSLRSFLSLLACVGSLLASSPAPASITYPPAIQGELMLAKAPECTLCHRNDVGGAGTVVRPFGRTLMTQFGLVGGANNGALRSAISGSDSAAFDSDGDGASDIDELRVNTDPNVGVSGVATAPDVPLPQTGCALGSRLPERGSPTVALLLATAGAICRLRRRATRSSRTRYDAREHA